MSRPSKYANNHLGDDGSKIVGLPGDARIGAHVSERLKRFHKRGMGKGRLTGSDGAGDGIGNLGDAPVIYGH